MDNTTSMTDQNEIAEDSQVNSVLQSAMPITSNYIDVEPSYLLKDTADPLYRTPIFLSYATPFNDLQMMFLNRVIRELRNVLLFPRTLGVSEVETSPPITAIRQMVLSSFGMLAIAFRRVLIKDAISRPGTTREKEYKDVWLSSPYLQVEPSMAYEQGLPLMILVEEGVITDGVFGGILEQGAAPLFIPIFSLQSKESINEFFNSPYWKSVFIDWLGQVQAYYYSLTSKVVQDGITRHSS